MLKVAAEGAGKLSVGSVVPAVNKAEADAVSMLLLSGIDGSSVVLSSEVDVPSAVLLFGDRVVDALVVA